MHRTTRDHYVLSTGRVLYANHGLISCARRVDRAGATAGFEIGEGYDERAELADFMRDQWSQFKAAS